MTVHGVLRVIASACVLSCGLFVVSGCKKDNPVSPVPARTAADLVGTWTGDGFTVVVASTYAWQGFGSVSYNCGSGSCRYSVDVTGTVQPPGTQYQISGSRRDSYGNIGSISGAWNADLTLLNGYAVAATSNGGRGIPFIARKL